MSAVHGRTLPPAAIIRWGLRAVWLAYLVTLFVLTHTPIPAGAAPLVSRWDKLLHFGAYFVLAVLTILVFLRRDPLRFPMRMIVVSLLAFAALDEYLQGFVNRSPDVKDWLCDSLGVLVAVVLARCLLGWLASGRFSLPTLLGPERLSSTSRVE